MKRDLSDSQTTTGHTAEQQVDGAANRAAAKVRRYRERKRAGIVLAAVEIEPEVLDFLAWGTHTSVETLKANRPQLADAVRSAIAKLLRDLQRRGKYPADRGM
jgi:hypothetical protein